jgi:hypothetical protein
MDHTMDLMDAPLAITVGFTCSDRAMGYSSFSDGYRLDAKQDVMEVTIPAGAPHLTGVEWAEAVFVATNAPVVEAVSAYPGAVLLWQVLAEARTRDVRLRSLTVGDTVTVEGVRWARQPTGWELADEPDWDSQPQDEDHYCESRCCTFARGCAGFRDDNPGFWAPGEEAAERAAWAREDADRRRYGWY